MTRLALLVLLAAPAAVPAVAQVSPEAPSPAARRGLGVATDAGAALWAEGHASLLAFQLDSANRAFRRLGAAEPASAAGALGLETVALWQALVMERPPFTDRFYALNDSLGRVAEALPETPEGDWVRATTALHRAILLGREERYARAGLAFRDACGQYRALPASVPDALFGQGVCEVAAGAVPAKYRWLGRILGFSGSVSGGIEKLGRAASGDGATATEAVAAFAMVDATLNERKAGGLARLRQEMAAHPGSPVYAYLVASFGLRDRDAVTAEADLRRAAAALARPGASPLPLVDADLGLALFRQDRFAEALPFLDRYVRTFRGNALLARTTLTAGLAAELTGDRRAAEAYYGRVRATRDLDADKSAAREAALRRASPMTPTERTLLLGQNAFDSDRLALAVRLLQPVLTDARLPETARAEAAYRTGRALQALGQSAEALRHFSLAVARPGDPLARWGPWSLYHVGEIHESAGQATEARRAYEAALAVETEYDFKTTLEQRVKTALGRLGA